MNLPSVLIIFFVAILADALGFYKFAYFVSLGYNLSVVANGIVILIMFRKSLTICTAILCAILIIYGLRLGIYLFIREHKSSSFRNRKEGQYSDGSNMNFFAKCSMWLGCGCIYACEVSPVFFRLKNATPDNTMAYVGIAIAVIGVLFESIGDQQKYNAKKENPATFVSSGLYKIVRCPNYLGEILVWTGIFLSGITAYNSIWQWIIATFGYICIVSVMISAVRTLEARQNKTYGMDERYQMYVRKTPIILPFIPIYTYKNQDKM